MYILWRYDVDWASGVGGDAEHTHTHTEGVASENKIIDIYNLSCWDVSMADVDDEKDNKKSTLSYNIWWKNVSFALKFVDANHHQQPYAKQL